MEEGDWARRVDTDGQKWACQGRVQTNLLKKRLMPRQCLGPLGGGISVPSSQVVSQPGRQEISPDRDNPGTSKNKKIGVVLLTASSSSQHEMHDIQHVEIPTSLVFRKYLDSGFIQPGTPVPTLQSSLGGRRRLRGRKST